MNENAEREAFEKWAPGNGYIIIKDDDGEYLFPVARMALDVWQARAAAPPPPVQGEVTCAMVDAAMSSWFGVTYDGRGARKEMATAIAAALSQAEGRSTSAPAPAGVNAKSWKAGAEAMRELCAAALEAQAPECSGPEYGMAPEDTRKFMRNAAMNAHWRANFVRKLPIPDLSKQGDR